MPVTKKITDLALANVAAGDDVPIAQGGFLKRAKAGQANGLAILDSAGMPLDSAGRKVVAYGTNSNGTYIRFADGTQICFALNMLAGPSPQTWTYPSAFVSTPVVSFISHDPGYILTGDYNIWNNTQARVRKYAIASGTEYTGTGLAIDAIAIGRWY